MPALNPNPRPRLEDAVHMFPALAATVWQGSDVASVKALPSDYAALDALLPGNGWPIGSLSELIAAEPGIGELSLLLPVLRKLANEQRRIVLIQPPHIPYAPALARAGLPLQKVCWIHTKSDSDARWAAEQVLRAGTTGAVLLWSETADDRLIRRLQLAAETGHSLAFLFRSLAALRNASPAALRLALRPSHDTLEIQVLKSRGGRTGTVVLPRTWAAA